MDRKFGLHGLWIVPCGIALMGYGVMKDRLNSFIHKRKIKKSRRNVEIDELSKLSGIK
jgi:hypothetical protein